jgi:hypothetical protein
MNTEPMELEDLPLQVALLTMDLAALRQAIADLAGMVDDATG